MSMSHAPHDIHAAALWNKIAPERIRAGRIRAAGTFSNAR